MSNDIPEDEDLHIDLRGFDFTNKKKEKEKKDQEDDSLVINDSGLDIDGASLVIGDDIEVSDDSLVLGDGAELEDNTEDNTEIKSGNVLLDDDFVIDEYASNVSGNSSSIFSSDISDKGISLEGGLELNKEGKLDAWTVDLDIDYANPDSGTMLMPDAEIEDNKHSDEFDLDASASNSDTKQDSIISDVYTLSDLEETFDTDDIIKPVPSMSIRVPVEEEWPVAFVIGIIIISFFMLIGSLAALDVLVCSACPTPNCHVSIVGLIAEQLGLVD